MKSEQELRRERRIGWIVSIVLLSIAGIPWLIVKFATPLSRVSGGSMSPTIHRRDYVAVNRMAYRLGAKPEVGDIAAYRSPIDEAHLIHRIVAGPGDTIEMRDNVLFRNGQQIDEPYIRLTPDIPAVRSFGPVKVPPGQYFFLGDNRDNANDSRFLGGIPEDRIRGRMSYVLHIGDCDTP